MKKLIIIVGCILTLQTVFAQDTTHRAQAIDYAKRAKQQYVAENFDSAVILYRMALNMDSTLSWIQFNNALACIIHGKGDPVENYTKALMINEHTANGKQVLSNAINDLDDAQRKYGPLIDYDMVREILIDRYGRYQ